MRNNIKNLLSKIYNYKYFNIICTAIYKILLDVAFIIFAQNATLDAYKLNFNVYKLVFGIFSVGIIYYCITKVKDNLTKFFIGMFYYLMFIPITTVFALRNYSIIGFMFFFIEFIIIIYTTIYLNKKLKEKKHHEFNSKILKSSSLYIYIFFLLSTFITIAVCIFYNGLPTLTALNFRKVYSVREVFMLPKYAKYLFNVEVKFITPFLITLYIHKKRYVKMSLMILIQLFFFLISGNRIIILSIPLVIGSYMVFKYLKNYKYEKILSVLFALACVISILTYPIDTMIFGLFVRRLLFVPSIVKFWYFDFFSTNPKIGIVGTLLNAFIKLESPYKEMTYQNLIPGVYINNYQTYANTGMLIEGFVRFGYWGIFIIPLLMGVVLYIINYGSKRNGTEFMIGISILALMNLNDGYLLPTLMFGPVTLLIIISVFFDVNLLDIKTINKKMIGDDAL